MMETIAWLLAGVLLAALIIPWVNLARLNTHKSELRALKARLDLLQDGQRAEVKPSVAPEPVATPKEAEEPPPIAMVAKPEKEASPAGMTSVSSAGVNADQPERVSPGGEVSSSDVAKKSEPKERQDWFSKIAVWVGGVALLMAGFYMVKYSIDSGWLTPAVRVGLTAGFGVLLCAAGFVISLKSKQVANGRIGQALSGAGVACLYFAAYAAVHLYGFLGSGQGFGCMIAVTVLAVALSLKNGAPIAMMGLVGGFLTPWLMRTGFDDTAMLFTYLFLLFCGAQFLCMRRGWWGLLLASLMGAYLWSLTVIFGCLDGSVRHVEGAMFFVMGICAVNAVWVLVSQGKEPDGRAGVMLPMIRVLAWGGGLAQSLLLVWLGGFAGVDMSLFGVLSVGALLLAVLREEAFIWAAWLALVAVAVGAVSNPAAELVSWLAWPTGLMLTFFAVGHWRGLRPQRALVWRGLSTTAAIIFAPILYVNRELLMERVVLFDGFWLVLASATALLLLLAGEHLFRREADRNVAGEYQGLGVFLIGFGLWTYVPVVYLAHSVAGLLMASVLYWRWRGFGRARLLFGALAAAWGLTMVPLAVAAVAYFFGETYYRAANQDGVAVLAWALGALGGGLAVALFRESWSEGARKVASRAAGLVFLFGLVAVYQWLHQSCMPASWARPAVEGGLTTLLAGLALAGRLLAPRWSGGRVTSGLLAGLAGVRIALLHLGDSGAAGESFFFNALLLQFGVPFAVAFALAWLCAEDGAARLRKLYQLAAMLLGFVWSTFLVQDYFGGNRLLGGSTSSTELYTYSAVWLLLAVAYQAIGLWRNQKAIHVGSLVLLLVTIGKVFLVDASELEGLFRVLSFLGLGVALIGIGFFYNKIVFARRESA